MDLNHLRYAGRVVTMPEGHGIWVLRGGPAPSGDAVADVFLHGLGGSSLPYRACAEAAEAAGAPTLCIDLRGHGFSEKPDGDAGIDDYTADVLRVLKAEGVTRANLVGHCLGGIVAMRVAEIAPEMVAALVLIGTSSAAVASPHVDLRVPVQARIHQALASPHANDDDAGRLTTIDDPKRPQLEFAKPRRVELRDELAAVREHRELVHSLNNGRDQALPDVRRVLGCVPRQDLQQVVRCRLGELDGEPRGHQARPKRRFTSAIGTTRPASMSASPATTARMNSRSSCAAS